MVCYPLRCSTHKQTIVCLSCPIKIHYQKIVLYVFYMSVYKQTTVCLFYSLNVHYLMIVTSLFHIQVPQTNGFLFDVIASNFIIKRPFVSPYHLSPSWKTNDRLFFISGNKFVTWSLPKACRPKPCKLPYNKWDNIIVHAMADEVASNVAVMSITYEKSIFAICCFSCH